MFDKIRTFLQFLPFRLTPYKIKLTTPEEEAMNPYQNEWNLPMSDRARCTKIPRRRFLCLDAHRWSQLFPEVTRVHREVSFLSRGGRSPSYETIRGEGKSRTKRKRRKKKKKKKEKKKTTLSCYRGLSQHQSCRVHDIEPRDGPADTELSGPAIASSHGRVKARGAARGTESAKTDRVTSPSRKEEDGGACG